MTSIILKDKALADQTFTFKTILPNGSAVFERIAGPLVGRAELTLSLSEGANVNRVKAKLSIPKVCVTTPSNGDCGRPVVEYTQVGSLDISVVRFSSEVEREDMSAMLNSLAGNPVFKSIIVNGDLPRA